MDPNTLTALMYICGFVLFWHAMKFAFRMIDRGVGFSRWLIGPMLTSMIILCGIWFFLVWIGRKAGAS